MEMAILLRLETLPMARLWVMPWAPREWRRKCIRQQYRSYPLKIPLC
jgi:hypothetical protein